MRVLFIFFFFWNTFSLATFNNENDLAHGMMLRIQYSPNSKSVNGIIESIESHSNYSNLDSKEVIKNLIFLVSERINFYQELETKPKNYKRSALLLMGKTAVSAFFYYIIYLINTTDVQLAKEKIEKKISELGGTFTISGGGRASTLVSLFNPNGKLILNELKQLANLSRGNFGLLCWSVVGACLTTILTTEEIIKLYHMYYSHYYYEQYCLIKSELENYLQNVIE